MNPASPSPPLVLPEDAAGAPGVASAAAGRLHRQSHEAMACTWGLLVYHEDARYAEQASRAVFAEIDRLERELSRFIPDSDVSRINAQPPRKPLRVGLDCFECLDLAVRMYARTRGAFDVTIGALLSSARECERGQPAPHTAAPPAANAPSPPFGLQHLALHRPTLSVATGLGGLIVDLGGIGKGYAIDRAALLLDDWSIPAALLHSGQSTVLARGAPPGQSCWTIGIRSPRDPSVCLGSVPLRGGSALSGSGALLHGRHILDPRTGRLADAAAGAWAIAPTAAESDVLSTAFMVLHADEVAQVCREHSQYSGLAAYPPDERLVEFGSWPR